MSREEALGSTSCQAAAAVLLAEVRRAGLPFRVECRLQVIDLPVIAAAASRHETGDDIKANLEVLGAARGQPSMSGADQSLLFARVDGELRRSVSSRPAGLDLDEYDPRTSPHNQVHFDTATADVALQDEIPSPPQELGRACFTIGAEFAAKVFGFGGYCRDFMGRVGLLGLTAWNVLGAARISRL